MRSTLLVSALTGAAFAQYHVPTQGETIVPVTTTGDVVNQPDHSILEYLLIS